MLHGRQLLFGNKFGASAHNLGKRTSGSEHVNETTARSVGSPLQRMQGNASADFGLFKLDDARLADSHTPRELSGRHAESVANSAQPALRRAHALRQRPQYRKSLIEMASCFIHMIRYSL